MVGPRGLDIRGLGTLSSSVYAYLPVVVRAAYCHDYNAPRRPPYVYILRRKLKELELQLPTTIPPLAKVYCRILIRAIDIAIHAELVERWFERVLAFVASAVIS
ncbi:hypothetical protein OH77DRAFT_1190866 [Trametes cingulata]|nr:hypothetical protein OH77DRAFT_1190866 [Trametes cingulata]